MAAGTLANLALGQYELVRSHCFQPSRVPITLEVKWRNRDQPLSSFRRYSAKGPRSTCRSESKVSRAAAQREHASAECVLVFSALQVTDQTLVSRHSLTTPRHVDHHHHSDVCHIGIAQADQEAIAERDEVAKYSYAYLLWLS